MSNLVFAGHHRGQISEIFMAGSINTSHVIARKAVSVSPLSQLTDAELKLA